MKLSIILVLLTSAFAQQPAFTVNNPKKLHWPEKRADSIYWAACTEVAREIGLKKAPHPIVTLRLGTDDLKFKFILSKDSKQVEFFVEEKEWNERYFALAATAACSWSVIPYERFEPMSKIAMSVADSTVSVEELKEHK